MFSALSILEKRYPLDENIKRHIVLAASLSIWALLFLWLSEPFDIQDLSIASKLKLVPISAAVGGVCFSLALTYQNSIIRKAQIWKLKNELIFLFLGLVLSFICLYMIYRNTLNLGDKVYGPFQYFYSIFLPVYVMILPAIVIGRLALNKFFVKRKNSGILDSTLVIRGNGKSDYLSLPEKDLLYLKASDNYVEVNFFENGQPQTHILRAKLSSIEKDTPKLVRVHRSFIINPVHFRRFKNTKSGTFAAMGNGDLVPVSKSFRSKAFQRLTSTTNQ